VDCVAEESPTFKVNAIFLCSWSRDAIIFFLMHVIPFAKYIKMLSQHGSRFKFRFITCDSQCVFIKRITITSAFCTNLQPQFSGIPISSSVYSLFCGCSTREISKVYKNINDCFR
jgi:hypothetical protein